MQDIPQFDAPQWANWLENREHIARKLKGADPGNLEAYFLKIHAASEALFRRFLFIGLRLNRVPFSEAADWLNHNDATPSKQVYPSQFDRLYRGVCTFNDVLSSSRRLDALWPLWNSFSKIIRNHLAHGMRAYERDWLMCALRIDQALMIDLDNGLAPFVGGSGAGNLALLNPRLPTGDKNADIPLLLGKKAKQARPSISLLETQAHLNSFNLWP